MNTKYYFITEGIIDILFAISLIFMPAYMSEEYLFNPALRNEVTDLLCQQFGAILLAAGIANLSATKAEISTIKTGVILLGVIANCLFVIFHIVAINKGIETSFAWGTVVMQVAMSVWGIICLREK